MHKYEVKYPITFTSMKEIEACGFDKKQLFKAILVGAGSAMTMTEEGIETIMEGDFPELVKRDAAKYTPGPYISGIAEFWAVLNKEEQFAIFFHEEAHLELGHLVNAQQEDMADGNILNVLQHELEADQYVVRKMGTGKYMRSALMKLISRQVEILYAYIPESEEKITLEAVVNDPGLIERMKALEAS